MKADRLEYEGFRNLKAGEFRPSEGVNIVYGDNGQGKTNLLEALWLFTGGRSFRGARDGEMKGFAADKAALRLEFTAEDRAQEAAITIQKRRAASIGGIPQPSPSRLAGRFCAVVFSPAHLSLIKDGPEERRRFLDAALCQLYPGYLATLRRYSRLIAQKNSLLKFWERTPGAAEMCDAFDADLAVQGEEIRRRRAAFLDGLAPLAKKNYEEISSGSEALSLCYRCGFETGGLAGTLAASRMADRKAGYCTAGPHRDDLELELDGRPAKNFASQGQQRSAVLSIKLAQAALAAEVTGEHPVMLLDDVLSELDPARQEYLLTRVRQKQTIVTACDSSLFHKAAGVMLKMDGGRLSEG